MRIPRRAVEIIRDQEHPWRFTASRLLRASRLDSWITFRASPEVRLRLYPTPVTEMYWTHGEAAYSDDQRFYRQTLRPGVTVVDVGANVGAVAIQASRLVGDQGRVIAIEAHPRTYGYLLGNLELNGCTNVEPINVAVGASSGTIGFSDLKSDDLNHVESRGLVVPVETLDHLIGDVPVFLLKVDVEGYERFVLEGARQVLRATQWLYIESFDTQFERYDYRASDMISLLRDSGFEVYGRSDRRWRRVPPDHTSPRVENLVAARDADAVAALEP